MMSLYSRLESNFSYGIPCPHSSHPCARFAAATLTEGVGFLQGRSLKRPVIVKFDKAEQVLKDLADFLNSNEQTKKMPAVGKQGMTVGQYINAVLNLLKKEKENIPKMMQAQVSQNYAARGGSDSQEKASPIVDPQGNPFMRKVV